VRRLVALALVAALFGACGDDDADGALPIVTTPRATTSTSSASPAYEARVETVTAEDLYASWRAGCPLAVEELRRLQLMHWGFDGAVHDGQIVVAADVADDVVSIFGELYAARYPIEKMAPVDVYGGSDEASTEANNTSAFNCRRATGGTGWSEHAFGRAIDLNPLQNPYIRGDTVLPAQSARYLDRSLTDIGVIHDGDAAVTAFAARGWIWGGTWQTLKDYQHFSPSGR
jgi:hypothetical protein